MKSDNASTSGSEKGLGPAYTSLHGFFDDPTSEMHKFNM